MARITGIRAQELDTIVDMGVARAQFMTAVVAAPTTMSTVAFLVLGATTGLDAAAVFSCMAFFNMLQFAIIDFPGCINGIVQGKVSARRVSLFLNAKELGESEPDRVSLQSTGAEMDPAYAVALEAAAFRWEATVVEGVSESSGDTVTDASGSSTPAESSATAPPVASTSVAVANEANTTSDALSNNIVTPETTVVATAADSTAAAASAAGAAGATAVVPPVLSDVLSNITLHIPRGALTMIVGAVGSGKSSLLAGLLGEIKRTAGTVTIRGRVGYAAQIPWIQNASLRDNMYDWCCLSLSLIGCCVCVCVCVRLLDTS